ncbi:hypothetical protein HN011_003137 [Eciton burchellii]|jgi:hypothetical protein|nr:hypothetical protein HN011_003137 [Eciton burchellii]
MREAEVANVGQEPGPGLAARADISINSYESRIERARLVMQIRHSVLASARARAALSSIDTNANATSISRSKESLCRSRFSIDESRGKERSVPIRPIKSFPGNLAHLEISDATVATNAIKV